MKRLLFLFCFLNSTLHFSQNETALNELAEKSYDAFQEKEFTNSIAYAKKGLQLDPKYTYLIEMQCYGYSKLQYFDSIAITIDSKFKAFKELKKEPSLNDLMGTTLYFLQRKEEALPYYQKMMELQSDDARYYNNYLKLLTELRHNKKAIEVFNFYLLQDYNGFENNKQYEHDVFFYGALAYLFEKEYEKALTYINHCIELKPDYRPNYNNRSIIYAKLDRNVEAMTDTETCIRLAPDHFETYYDRGVLYQELGDDSLAVLDYEKAIELGKNEESVYNNLGNAYKNVGDYDKSLKNFEKSLTINPNYKVVYLNMADLFQYRKEYKNACNAYETYINYIKGANENVLSNYGYALFETDNYKKALEQFEKAFDKNNEEIDVVLGLIMVNSLLDNKAKVQKYSNHFKTTFKAYLLDIALLDKLSNEGYYYTDTFKKAYSNALNE